MKVKGFFFFSFFFFLKFKGILRPIFCIDVDTHIDKKWKIVQNLLKKLFFQNV